MSHQWTMEDFESIYSVSSRADCQLWIFVRMNVFVPKRFYEWRSKLLRKGGFIPVKVNSKGQVSLPIRRNPCCLPLRSARRQFPSRYVRSPIPMASQSRLNSPLSPEVLQTLIFLNSNR